MRLIGVGARPTLVALSILCLFPFVVRSAENAPDARAKAISTAREMSEAALDRYEKSGHVSAFASYRITVPRSWTETNAGRALCTWPEPGTPQLLTLRKSLPSFPCGPPPSTGPEATVNDGVILYAPGAEPYAAVATLGRLLITRRPSTAVVRVYAVPRQLRQLLVMYRDGGYTFQLAVAVGRDGRTAGRIVASIRPNPDDA